jgi:DNA-binding response OmpR family regulator
MKTILIVDDDPALVEGLKQALEAEHFAILAAMTGEQGRRLAKREKIDLVILDLKLPDMKGEDICREMRKNGLDVPVLMLTSKKREMDKVVGLEIGADDYMTKPFSVRELIARVNALLRRGKELQKDLEGCSFGDVVIDFQSLEASKAGKPIKLTVKEFHILKFFALHIGELVTRDMLLDKVWGYEKFPTTRTVDNYVLSLRKKIEDDAANPRHLLTVHTAGYRFLK